MTRVLVVARSAVARTRLESIVARLEGVAVAGAAEWPPTDSAGESEPDVVLLVLESGDDPPSSRVLGGASGVPRLVVLGPDPLERWAPGAMRRGAQAVLPADPSSVEIGATLDAVMAGLAVLPPSVAAPARLRADRRLGGDAAAQPVTRRESEILELLAAGLGNKAIATRLDISSHTVKTHVESLFEKLGVATRAEAVAAGVRRGILML
ncbi:MAG: response regulator transcription factor [Gemmatimonadales bacterium]